MEGNDEIKPERQRKRTTLFNSLEMTGCVCVKGLVPRVAILGGDKATVLPLSSLAQKLNSCIPVHPSDQAKNSVWTSQES